MPELVLLVSLASTKEPLLAALGPSALTKSV
jgi:hypothetical protein